MSRDRRFALLPQLALLAALTLMGDGRPAAAQVPENLAVSSALERITADSLKGHLSFLASDLLEGRDTPSRGLDLAAEYIAAQFRRAGLEPIGDEGYFQTARWIVSEPDPASFAFEIRIGDATIRVSPERVSLAAPGPIDLGPTAVVKLDAPDVDALQAIPIEQVEGKVVLVTPPAERRAQGAYFARLMTLKPALAIALDASAPTGNGLGRGRLIDPEARGGAQRGGFLGAGPRRITLHDPQAIARLQELPAGATEATVSLRLGPPVDRPVALRNVIGLLRGSDPELKETYILLTAHYDHVGIGDPENGDRIYNGANDDGSGTVSVIEVASALATLPQRPKRSLVFLTFFGEEKGLLGSRYYGRHPVVPLLQTVAQVNLEQVGRTDDNEGPRVGGASATGFDYSSVIEVFRRAGDQTGVKLEKHPRNSDAFFGASDNQALADLGVPAHTLCTAFLYPDYHRAGDHWDKVDYANMARIDRMIALGLCWLADDPAAPTWNAENPRAARYAAARAKAREAQAADPKP